MNGFPRIDFQTGRFGHASRAGFVQSGFMAFSPDKVLRPQSKQRPAPTVSILLGTYHGQHYLRDQLQSIAGQSHENWHLWVSDDGSQDDTCKILDEFRRQWGAGRLSTLAGPAKGFAANFLSLACKPDIEADFYAYSDQDDIWEKDKLKRAIDWLETVPADVPALYCSRTRLIDAANREIGFSPLFSKPPSFANALVQNIGGGNTMVFNGAARKLLCQAGKDVDVVSHDWWAYIVVSGCGGRVHYDAQPSLRYRQHGGNLIGRNTGFAARRARIRLMWQGSFKRWHDQNLEALLPIRSRLTPENQRILDSFSAARRRPLVTRVLGLKRSGVYRQTLGGNLGLVAAAIFNKI